MESFSRVSQVKSVTSFIHDPEEAFCSSFSHLLRVLEQFWVRRQIFFHDFLNSTLLKRSMYSALEI